MIGHQKLTSTFLNPMFFLAKTRVCTGVRGVCTFFEVRRTDSPSINRKIHVPSKNILAKPLRPARISLVVMSILGSSFSASADGWGSNGNFKLAGGVAVSQDWVLPITDWQSNHAFEKSTPGYETNGTAPVVHLAGSSSIDKLLSLISSVESPRRQYDAYHHSARVPPPALPTDMTLGQILDWIVRTPRQHHAIGRYQIVPDTLQYLIKAEGLPLSARFDRSLQDRLAKRLLVDAGLNKFLSEKRTPDWAMDRVAKVWAGLPMQNDKSAYDGYAGNRAVISRVTYRNAFSQIFSAG